MITNHFKNYYMNKICNYEESMRINTIINNFQNIKMIRILIIKKVDTIINNF